MLNTENIFSLSDFQHNTQAHMQRLKDTGKPEVLTVDGHAELVVQNASAYQDLIDKMEAIEGIRAGLSAMQNHQGRAVDEFFSDFTEKHQLTK